MFYGIYKVLKICRTLKHRQNSSLLSIYDFLNAVNCDLRSENLRKLIRNKLIINKLRLIFGVLISQILALNFQKFYGIDKVQ